eukprot:TRINITY_DN55294_c0_g1_i1.p2 TRINITY_DN55294_c0_g1~~TRINITY_DN55294_c0_g1_i1.p2  ORF type:complete len:122 (+),score=11.05 TRINITY_DN55294_c0_g1_i1:388-753(+)
MMNSMQKYKGRLQFESAEDVRVKSMIHHSVFKVRDTKNASALERGLDLRTIIWLRFYFSASLPTSRCKRVGWRREFISVMLSFSLSTLRASFLVFIRWQGDPVLGYASTRKMSCPSPTWSG